MLSQEPKFASKSFICPARNRHVRQNFESFRSVSTLNTSLQSPAADAKTYIKTGAIEW